MMFAKFITAVCCIALFTCSASALDSKADARCSRGICAGAVCCPAGCGTCGGTKCQERELGAHCCRGWVSQQGRSCSSVGPPCVVDSGLQCGGTSPSLPAPSSSPISKPGGMGDGKWEEISNSLQGKPTARHEACFVMASGRGYLIGGRGDRPVEMLNPRNGKWIKIGPLPTQMHHMQCVYYRRKIYVPTSWYGSAPRESINEDMWVFDIDKRTWSKLPAIPENRRRAAAASVVYNQKIYVLGGNRGGHGSHSVSLGWVDAYNLITNKWETGLASLPAGHERDHVGAAVLPGGKICIAGGRNGGVANFFEAVVTSTFCYDVRSNKWTDMKAPIPEGRAGAATARTCDGKLIIAGGEGRFSAAFNRVDVFDGKKWETLSPLQRARHGTGLAVSNCKYCSHIFIASGSGARGGSPELTSTEHFVPNGTPRQCSRF